MRIFEKTTANCLENFLQEQVPRLGHQRTPVYRGQASIDLAIVPTLLRQRLHDTQFSTWIELESSLMLSFKQRAVCELAHKPHSELEWRAMAHHYGLPTRFTSWTETGLVALFFATEVAADESDGVVWCLVPGDSDLVVAQDYEQVPEGTRIYHAENTDTGMRNQRTCLLSHPLPEHDTPPLSFEDYYQCGDERIHLYQIRIPHAEKSAIRKQLALTGIDARFLFPGLHGLCRHLQDEIYAHTNSYEWIFDRV